MSEPATAPPPRPAPSVVDILARQALALAEQSKAMRAALDALDRQADCLLEVVRMLQDADAQRRAAATARAGAEESGPKMPPVFGHRSTTVVALPVDAPPLPPVPEYTEYVPRPKEAVP